MFNSDAVMGSRSCDSQRLSRSAALAFMLLAAMVAWVPLAGAAITQDTTRQCTNQQATVEGADASDCIGILLGDNGGEVNNVDLNNSLIDGDTSDYIESLNGKKWIPGAFERDGWEEMARVESNASGNLGFTVTPAPGQVGNDGMLTWSTTTALNGTWVVRVKQATEAVFWLFEGLQGATGGTVKLETHNNEYSNISLISGRSSPPGDGEVPVPSSLLLLSFGGVLLVARRRRQGRK